MTTALERPPQETSMRVEQMDTHAQVVGVVNTVYGRFENHVHGLRRIWEEDREVAGATFRDRDQNRRLLIDFYITQHAMRAITGGHEQLVGTEADYTFPVPLPGHPDHREGIPVDCLRRFLKLEKEDANHARKRRHMSRGDYDFVREKLKREDDVLERNGQLFTKAHPDISFDQRASAEAFIASEDQLRRGDDNANYIEGRYSIGYRRELVLPAV